MNPNTSIELVLRFWQELWNPPYNFDVIDEILSEDFVLVSAGLEITTRTAFKELAATLRSVFVDGRFHVLDSFASADGSKVVGRWKTVGKNHGIFGLPPDGATVEFTGISIWEVRGNRLTKQWVERSALECYRANTERQSDKV